MNLDLARGGPGFVPGRHDGLQKIRSVTPRKKKKFRRPMESVPSLGTAPIDAARCLGRDAGSTSGRDAD